MLESENTINIEHVIEEVMKTNINKASKVELLQRLKSYSGWSRWDFIDDEIKKVQKKYNRMKKAGLIV